MSLPSQPARTRPAVSAAGVSGALALALLSLPALALLWRAGERLAALLAYPFPHDSLEGTLLHEARLMRAGEPLYQPLELYRFVSAPYPPLHPLLLGWADQIAGPHIFWGGRLISLVSALVAAVLVLLLGRRAGGSWLGGLFGAGVFLSAAPVLLWGTRIKPDLLALAFTALGLLLAADEGRRTKDEGGRTNDQRPTTNDPSSRAADKGRGAKDGRGRLSMLHAQLSILLAAVCFVLAFYAKQTAVAAPLAVGIALLIGDVRAAWAGERAGRIGPLPLRWRTLLFSLVYLALALGVWLALDLATQRQYTLHVWWNGERTGWWSFALMRKFVALLEPYRPLMLVGAGLVVYGLRTGRALVPACYMLVAPLTLFAAGETGANHNHLLETLLALSVAAGSAAGLAAAALARRPALALPALALLALQVPLLFAPPPHWYTGQLEPDSPPDRYVKFILNTPGEILTDDPGLLLLAGKPIRYDDPSTQGPAVRLGAWDQRGMLDDIANRRFTAIMLPIDVRKDSLDAAGRWTPEMLATIKEHYKVKFADTLIIYEPK
jgi:hypothetical protein